MTQVMHSAKWLIPVIVIVAMLAAVGIVWSQSSDGGVGITAEGDLNPGYENVVIIPPENAASATTFLYSIDVSPEAAMIAADSGDIMTIVVTNLTAADGTGFDLSGNVMVTAAIYNPLGAIAPVLTFMASAPQAVVTFTDITVHPEKAVTLQVPIRAFYNALGGPTTTPQGMILEYKATASFLKYDMAGTFVSSVHGP